MDASSLVEEPDLFALRSRLAGILAASIAEEFRSAEAQIVDLQTYTAGQLDLAEICPGLMRALHGGEISRLLDELAGAEQKLLRRIWRSSQQEKDARASCIQVLMLGDAPGMPRLVRQLGERGLLVHSLPDLSSLTDSVMATRCDAMVVGLEAGGVPGSEVIRVLAAEAKFAHIPKLLMVDGHVDLALEGPYPEAVCSLLQFPLEPERVQRCLDAAVEVAQIRRRLKRATTTDPVTGFLHGDHFRTHLEATLIEHAQSAEASAFLLFSVQGMDALREAYGPAVWERLIRTLGLRLLAALGPDACVTRLSDNEFGVLVAGVASAAEAGFHAETLMTRIALPVLCESVEMCPQLRCGIALAAPGMRDANTLLRQAISALTHAGRHELTIAFFHRDTLTRASNELKLSTQLRRAMGNGELELYFQPQVCLREARCLGAEALLRWRHPAQGLLLPTKFIPQAEDNGLIRELGEWVIDAASAFLAELRDGPWCSGLERVSLNLSPKQLDAAGLIHQVEGITRHHGIDAAQFEFELTEHRIIRQPDGAARTLDALRQLGSRVAIDDFGAGFGTFAYLKRFPVDTIKIDRSLIKDMLEGRRHREIVRAIVSLANTLGLFCVAEGVEHLAELSQLHHMRCDAVQGFFVSRPLPAAAFMTTYCSRKVPAVSTSECRTGFRDTNRVPLQAVS